jgi:hypothetical protein
VQILATVHDASDEQSTLPTPSTTTWPNKKNGRWGSQAAVTRQDGQEGGALTAFVLLVQEKGKGILSKMITMDESAAGVLSKIITMAESTASMPTSETKHQSSGQTGS